MIASTPDPACLQQNDRSTAFLPRVDARGNRQHAIVRTCNRLLIRDSADQKQSSERDVVKRMA
jgi:hypothetical protein